MTNPDKAPAEIDEKALDQAAGGGNIEMAAWHELVILGDVAPARKSQTKAPDGKSG